MDGDAYGDQGGLTEYARVGARLAMTVGIAALGVVAAVALAGRESESPERSRAATIVATPAPAGGKDEFRLSGAAPPTARFFIVATEAAREELLSAIAGEALVRIATHEPARLAWVVVAETDDDARALADLVNADAGTGHGGDVAVEVIDVR